MDTDRPLSRASREHFPAWLWTAVGVMVPSVASSASGGESGSDPRLGVSRVEDSVRVTWTAQPARRYRLEVTTNLSGNWSTAVDLQSASGGNGDLSWTDTNAVTLAGSRFYRVVDLGGTNLGALAEEAAFLASDLVPVELSELYARSAQDAADAIAFATAMVAPGGAAVTHGTVRVTGNPGNPAIYEPGPTDRLVLVPIQGPTVEVYVQELDVARGIYQWRQVSGDIDLVFRSEPSPQGTRIRVAGRYGSPNFAGVSFEADLTGLVSGFSEVDSTGSHSLNDTTVRGTIAAEGFRQTVDTRSRFEFVSVRGGAGQLRSSSTSENWNNNTVAWGGSMYRWNNVKRQRSFRDGKESELDTYWNAVGSITRDGVEFGRYRKTMAAVGTSVIDLRFQVVLADRVVDVERWLVQVPNP